MKFNDDSCFSNPYNAMVSGVDKEELLYLEINFLKLIDFKLAVDPKTFESYYNHLVDHSQRKAVLCNCSCLDPTHSYKTFKNYEINSHENVAEKHGRTSIEVMKNENATKIRVPDGKKDNRNNSNLSMSKVHTQDSIKVPKSREDSISEVNKLMEQELQFATGMLDSGEFASFNSESRSKQPTLVDESSIRSLPRSDRFSCSKENSKAEEELMKNTQRQYINSIDHRNMSRYPTCKYDKESHLRIESHKVSF